MKNYRRAIKKLTRTQLRELLILLREKRIEEIVTIETPLKKNEIEKKLINLLKKRFKSKTLEFVKNKKLIAGMRINANHNVLDLSVEGIFRQIVYDRY